jgi:electron transfer flavoprotein beta subunit
MGADEGSLLTDRKFAGADCLATSYALAQAIQHIGVPDLVICGKQTTDGDTAQVGAEIAEFLGLPHVTNVRKLREIRADAIVAEMDLPNQVAVVEILLPCLITVEKDIYPPRLPSYRRKVATRDRKVRMLSLKDLEDQDEEKYGLKGSPTRVIRIFPPEANTDNEIWQGTGQELAERLVNTLRAKKLIGD